VRQIFGKSADVALHKTSREQSLAHCLPAPVIQLSGNSGALSTGSSLWTMEGSLSMSYEQICKRPLQRKVILWQDKKCDPLDKEHMLSGR